MASARDSPFSIPRASSKPRGYCSESAAEERDPHHRTVLPDQPVDLLGDLERIDQDRVGQLLVGLVLGSRLLTLRSGTFGGGSRRRSGPGGAVPGFSWEPTRSPVA